MALYSTKIDEQFDEEINSLEKLLDVKKIEILKEIILEMKKTGEIKSLKITDFELQNDTKKLRVKDLKIPFSLLEQMLEKYLLDSKRANIEKLKSIIEDKEQVNNVRSLLLTIDKLLEETVVINEKLKNFLKTGKKFRYVENEVNDERITLTWDRPVKFDIELGIEELIELLSKADEV